MKTLSIKQPYAELIVSGRKTIELRSWNTNFRGKFLIHASKSPDKGAMKKFGFGSELPVGAIVGKVKLVDIKDYSKTENFEEDKNKHLADANWGGYGFILESAERVEAVPAKGQLGFWDFEF